jgi:hypothetical protein
MPKDSKKDQKEYNKNYYANHRDDLLARGKEKVQCKCCNVMISRVNFSKHLATVKHKLYAKLSSQS